MICALCMKKEANKKNTHFLTDGIIRNCLNIDGSKERDKGFYFDLSNNTAFVEFNFQRGTSVEKLEESLGRKPSEEEIEKAKSIPFSVDNVFCSDCEIIFTEIESQFISNILPKFRQADLSKLGKAYLQEIKLIRQFFYLQIWRTSICEDQFILSDESSENLRKSILNFEIINDSDIKHFPILITYLETKGEEKEFTTNYVGFTNDTNPNLIIMNDFIIQFFEDLDSLCYFDFHNLNSEKEFMEFVNYQENDFVVKIFHDEERKKFLDNFLIKEKVKQTLNYYSYSFTLLWNTLFGINPPIHTTQEYLRTIIGNDEFNVLKYSKENVVKITSNFIKMKVGRNSADK